MHHLDINYLIIINIFYQINSELYTIGKLMNLDEFRFKFHSNQS
jgi:UV DNA damage repair endonuclease